MAEKTKLVLGRGRLYFDRFTPGTTTGIGEMYLGNTPSLTVSQDKTTHQRVSSINGQRIIAEEIVTQESHSFNFSTDHISIENFAFWYGGLPSVLIQNLVEDVTEVKTVFKGRIYSLGASAVRPYGGARFLGIRLYKGAVLLSPNNYVPDYETGLVEIRIDAPDISNGDAITFEYDTSDLPIQVVTSQTTELLGSLRFVATNPVGSKKNVFFPCVALKPNGSVNLKGDNWQELGFVASARRLKGVGEFFYLYELVGAYPVGDISVIDIGGISAAVFPYWEDQLNHTINVVMAGRGY